MEAPELEAHPWAYLATCPECEAQAQQASWERALLKAWANATGPTSAAGKATVRENLRGHPDAEAVRRTRFNAVKHGLFARTATYFPAKPGKYPHCDGCEYLDNVCWSQTACLKRTELFLRHHVAFESRDPALLSDLRADTQAAVQGLINDMILTIAQDGGPRVKEVVWYYDREGTFHLAQWVDERGEERQIHELKAHPLLKPLIDYISRNAMTLADSGMTPRVAEEQDALEGHLADQSGDRTEALEFQRRATSALEDLRGMIARSQERVRADPVLLEHEGGGDG